MAKSSKKGHARPQTLADAHKAHAKRLKKMERAQIKFDQQRQKLTLLEAEIARLVRSSELPQHGDSARNDTNGLLRCRVIVNPRSHCLANGTYTIEDIMVGLRAYGIQADIGLKSNGSVARKLAREAIKRGDTLIIVAGGDGTIEDVAGELVHSPATLGILPIGTMNNIAQSMGIPLNLREACMLLGMATTRRIDVGSLTEHDGQHSTYFLEVGGVGLSALAAPLGQDAEKGRWMGLIGALGKFLAFRGMHVTIADEHTQIFQGPSEVVIVSNSPYSGKNMLIAPEAKMDDGLLDLSLYEGMNTVEIERYFMEASDGKHKDNAHVRFHKVRKVQITVDQPVEANADMTVLPKQSVWDFEVLPHALAVVAGNGIGLTVPVASAPAVLPPDVQPGHNGRDQPPEPTTGSVAHSPGTRE